MWRPGNENGLSVQNCVHLLYIFKDHNLSRVQFDGRLSACWHIVSLLKEPLSSVQHTPQSRSPCLQIPAQHVPSLHVHSPPSLHTPDHLLATPHFRLCLMDGRAFRAAGPELRNSKPRGLSQSTSVASSKVRLQTHLRGPAPVTAPHSACIKCCLHTSCYHLLSRISSFCHMYIVNSWSERDI